MSGILSDILDDDDGAIKEEFQNEIYKTEIKTQRKNSKTWICIDDIEYDN